MFLAFGLELTASQAALTHFSFQCQQLHCGTMTQGLAGLGLRLFDKYRFCISHRRYSSKVFLNSPFTGLNRNPCYFWDQVSKRYSGSQRTTAAQQCGDPAAPEEDGAVRPVPCAKPSTYQLPPSPSVRAGPALTLPAPAGPLREGSWVFQRLCCPQTHSQ